MENYEIEKENLKKLIADNGYEILVVNTYTGQSWDNPASKSFELIVGKTRLNPNYIKTLGWKTHYKETSAKCGLFYSRALGMSRSFEIVYNLSSWLFKDGYKVKAI